MNHILQTTTFSFNHKGGLVSTEVILGGMNPTLIVSENEATLADETQY